MNILGIETSCDETSAAVVTDGAEILSNVVASSAEMHIKTGGIIPEVAARQQIRAIIPLIQEALTRAAEVGNWKLEGGKNLSHLSLQNLSSHFAPLISNIDAIAVTVGPGLIGSLLVGVETAKTLAYFWKKPLISVNHLVAHLYANWVGGSLPEFPLVALVISGGHTDLVYMKDHGKIKLIGTTRDDAAGECFDKCARLLGLPYPGGPAIAAEAAKFQTPNDKFQMKLFPRPMIDSNDFDFSFSGLKTAVLNEAGKLEVGNEKVDKNEVRSGRSLTSHLKNPNSHISLPTSRLAAEVQEAIVDTLVEKTLRAVEFYKPKSVLLGGGVAANFRLLQKFALAIDHLPFSIDFRIPEAKLCTDNAAVIASCAFFNNHPVDWQKISANPELTIAS